MSKKQRKTLIEKLLTKKNIDYESLSYQTRIEGDVYVIDDPSVCPSVFKTLVLTGKESGPVVGVVRLIDHIDYKKMSKVTGNKKIGLVPLKDLYKTSGYLHGENTPVGIYHNKHYRIFYDLAIRDFEYVVVSAGEIGKMMKVKVQDLVDITEGSIVDIAERNSNV